MAAPRPPALPLLAALGLGAGVGAAALAGAPRPSEARTTPRELGEVRWLRSLPEAQAEARKLGRPILILFDEVPGCQTCVRYGAHVLSHPLIVEAAEDLFVPVVIYNNEGGADRAALEAFGEPAWNNPVVRIVDAELAPLAPRVSGDYSQEGLLTAMQAALTKTGRPVPGYLTGLLQELTVPRTEVAYYAMYCFWSGEVCLGGLDGVLETRAGFAGGKEVVEVRYDPRLVTRGALDAAAQGCGAPVAGAGFKPSVDDDKYQLRGARWQAVFLTPGQRTKVNARVGRGQPLAEVLSPRQQAALQRD
jgi:hypothetical protein